ncbi:ubiquitin carboxyl-terminal hydrolase 42-like [Opisthocomus hoazin]|uniref:ubiquitin carboxyl-terminal hydrolase 42-like n=1 Tax=Opisthocomus hoazin TaxID=30419 RepID=UPI003F53DDA6
MAPPQRILFPPEKICLSWQRRRGPGAGLYNVGNMCFINSVLQCLTYTAPLANYLLSREHSRTCVFILRKAALSSPRSRSLFLKVQLSLLIAQSPSGLLHDVQNGSIREQGPEFLEQNHLSLAYHQCHHTRQLLISSFLGIGEHFQLNRPADALKFLRCTVNAMQRACLHESGNLDFSSQSTTIVHQIFVGFLRSRGTFPQLSLSLELSVPFCLPVTNSVTCLSCKAVSDSYKAFLDVLLDIKPLLARYLHELLAASSVPAALEACLKPEQLEGENCFKCSKCDKRVAASKVFTIHRLPKVLTLCLKRRDTFTGEKITKVVEYPEYLDLRPYTSQTAGEPLLYTLYAVLVHSGDTCLEGHYFCYTKASNGWWYMMNDTSVVLCDIKEVLRQQAYLLFYVREVSYCWHHSLLFSLTYPTSIIIQSLSIKHYPHVNQTSWAAGCCPAVNYYLSAV